LAEVTMCPLIISDCNGENSVKIGQQKSEIWWK